MGIIADIYEGKGNGNCSANGISVRFKHVCIVNASGPFEPRDGMPGVRIEKHPAGERYGIRAVPVESGEGVGPMFGGCYVATSDSRFWDLVEELLGGDRHHGAVALHDRFETSDAAG